MQIINQLLTKDQFASYISTYSFGPISPNKIVLHHTWRPTVDQWQGQKSIDGMKAYYEGKGWTAGPHLYIALDGIWLFSPMNKDGIHAGKGNYLSIGIEMVGDYSLAKPSGEILDQVLFVIKTLQERLNISDDQIYFHRDYAFKASGCPGWAVTKEWLINQLKNYSNNLTQVNMDKKFVLPDWGKEAADFCQQKGIATQIDSTEKAQQCVMIHRLYKTIFADLAEKLKA